MEWLVLLLVAGCVGLGALVGGHRWRRRRTRRAELEQVRQAAGEDVTLLGEELRGLDSELVGFGLDDATRADHRRALDAYEFARRTLAKLTTTGEVSAVTDALSTGRYAVVCVEARVAGEPVPEFRLPCFYNPQHGPSTRYVVRTTQAGGTRTVPTCAQDAARVAAGEAPEARYVRLGSRRVPYWEAGEAFEPYGKGYFAGSVPAVVSNAVPPASGRRGDSDGADGVDDGGGGWYFGHGGMGGFDLGGGGGVGN